MTKVREFMTGWESPDTHQMIPLVWSDRNKENLRGTAKGKRFTPKLRPFDMLTEPNQRLKIFESADVRVGVESVTGTGHFRRNSDFDEVLIQFCGASHVESEFGKFDLGAGEVLVIPGGVSHRSTGTGDCLRMVLNLHEPIFKIFKDADHTSETTYTMRRLNGPNWPVPPAPPQALEKSFAGEGLLAHVVVSKYVDHVPLCRLERIFLRQGVDRRGTFESVPALEPAIHEYLTHYTEHCTRSSGLRPPMSSWTRSVQMNDPPPQRDRQGSRSVVDVKF